MKNRLYRAQSGMQIPSKAEVEEFIIGEYQKDPSVDNIAYAVQELYGINYETALNVVEDVLAYGLPFENEGLQDFIPDAEPLPDQSTFGQRYEYPELTEDSIALNEEEWGWDDSNQEPSLLNESSKKKGGSISKKKFVKKVVKDLRKAAEGMEQEGNEASTNDIPVGGRGELISNFRRGIKDLGNEFYAKQMYEGMPAEEDEGMAQWGGTRRMARKAARDWRNMFGKIPVGMFGPGVPNYLGFISPTQGQVAPQGQPIYNPFGVNVSYKRSPFRGRELTINNLPPFMMPYYQPQQRMVDYKYPGQVIRTKVPVETKKEETETEETETKQFGGGIMNPQRGQYGELEKYFAGGEDLPGSSYSAYAENDIDTKDITDPYFAQGGLIKAQFGNTGREGYLNVSSGLNTDTPGMYRFGTNNPTFNVGYTHALGSRARNILGADDISAGLTAKFPYANNTGMGIQGDLHADFDQWHRMPAHVEGDFNVGYDPHLGMYSHLIGSPQFNFGNVPATTSRRYGTGLKAGEFIGSVGPFAGASFVPGRERVEERFSIPAGVKGHVDFGIGRKGIKAGLSGYAGADLQGMGLEENKDLTDQLKAKYNYGVQANLKIPIKSARDYSRDLLSRVRDMYVEDEETFRPRIKHGGLIQAQEGFNFYTGENTSDIIDKSQDEAETFAYANKADRERWKELMDKSKALMDTAKNRKLWYQDIKPQNFSIDELQRFVTGVQDYNKDAQDYERARRKVKEGKIPSDAFARMYNERGWSKFDPNAMREGYKGQYQDAVDEALARKAQNWGVTNAVLELSGANALKRLYDDPLDHLKSLHNLTSPAGLAFSDDPYADFDKSLDFLELLPAAGLLSKAGKLGKFSKAARVPVAAETVPELSKTYVGTYPHQPMNAWGKSFPGGKPMVFPTADAFTLPSARFNPADAGKGYFKDIIGPKPYMGRQTRGGMGWGDFTPFRDVRYTRDLAPIDNSFKDYNNLIKLKPGQMNRLGGDVMPKANTGYEQNNDYQDWQRQKAEREALEEYNEYMNRNVGEDGETQNYDANANDAIYQQILNDRLNAYGINTNQNNQQQQQQQYPNQPQMPYQTGFSINPFQNIKDMFSPFKKNPYTGQNFDFYWMSQQGPARLNNGQVYQPAGQQTQQTGQPGQTSTDYFARAFEDLGISKEEYDAAKAAYAAGSLDRDMGQAAQLTDEQKKQIDIINRVENYANQNANPQQGGYGKPGYYADIKYNKNPWWRGGKQTLSVTNKWMDPTDPNFQQQQQQGFQDPTLNRRQQKQMNKYMNPAGKNYRPSINPEQNPQQKAYGGDLYRFQGTDNSQVNQKVKGTIHPSLMNYDPNANNMEHPDYTVDYKINKARTFDPSFLTTAKYLVGYGAKGIADAKANMYNKTYTGDRTTSDSLAPVNELTYTGGYSGLNQRPLGAPHFTGVVGSQSYAAQGGQMKYEQGGIYDLTEEEIGAILAAGGQIEFI